MRMLGSGLATTLEEMARKNEGALSGCLNLLLNSTLADRLWSPWITIAFSPAVAAAGLLAVYLVFLVLFLPLFLLSYILTSVGSFLFLLLLILVAARSLARSLAFAGSTLSVQREMSADFMKRLSLQVENVGKTTASLSSTLMLVASGRMGRVDTASISRKIEEVKLLNEVLPFISKWIDGAVKELSVKDSYGKDLVSPEEIEVISEFKRAMDILHSNFAELAPIAKTLLQEPSSKSRSLLTNGNVNISATVLLAGKCLQASENLKAASVATRTTGPPTGEEDGVMWGLRQILKINQGPTGSAKFAFAIMRQQLKSKFRAERITLTGSDKNEIDGVLIPCKEQFEKHDNEVRNEDFTSTKSTVSESVSPRRSQKAPEFPPSPMGTVLFCSPNAGLYECLSQAGKDSSWVGYYTSLGFDVCLFNYRGYSCSTGVPSPDAVKADARLLVNHLKSKRNIGRLIIHGESIGGLIACHVAKTEGADLLVCDRTFASLDAVAARLLGQWAGYGLRFLIRWDTDVVADYLQCKCPKVILQDPNDEIIANAASLKNGVATSLVLGDNLWAVSTLPHEYVLAGYLGQPIPHQDVCEEMLREAEDLGTPITERFVIHLSACIISISIKASKIKVKQARRRAALESAQSKIPSAGRVARRKSVEMRNISSNTHSKSNGTPSAIQEEGDVILSPYPEGSGGIGIGGGRIGGVGAWGADSTDDCFRPMEDKGRKGEDEDLDFSGSSDADSGTSSGSVLYDEGFEDGPVRRGFGEEEGDEEEEEGVDVSAEDRLERFCCGDVCDQTLDVWLKVWMVIARCNGGTGQLLGQAANTGLDGVRAWICAVILLSSRASRDARLPPSCCTLFQATKELMQVTDVLHTELAADASVMFLRRSFVLLTKRAKDCSLGIKKGLFGGGKLAANMGSRASVGSSFSLASLASWGNGSFLSRISLSSGSLLSSVNTSASTPVINPETCTKKEKKREIENSDVGKERSVERQGDTDTFENSDSSSSNNNSAYAPHSSSFSGLEYGDNESFTSSLEGGTHYAPIGPGGGHGQGGGVGSPLSSLSGIYSEPPGIMHGINIGVGSVVALHNGHNGWPSESELTSLSDVIFSAGFPLDSNLSPKRKKTHALPLTLLNNNDSEDRKRNER